MIGEVIAAAVSQRASDIHLQEGRLPLLRVGLQLLPWGKTTVCAQALRQWIGSLAIRSDTYPNISASFSWNETIRCRLHISREHAGVHAALRLLYPLADLPPDTDAFLLQQLGELRDGLVLMCGATGSGKTTALWRILCAVNKRRRCHIITLEDPIEYVLKGEMALISQQELGLHFDTFAGGVKTALRQDPDILLVGELRDRETMDAALTAAETGHLVLATLHTRSAAQAVSRLAGAYTGAEQEDMRCRLALVLQGILAQQRCCDEQGTHIIREILLQTPAVSQLIRCGKEHQLPTVMQTSAALGMRTMEQALRQYRTQ